MELDSRARLEKTLLWVVCPVACDGRGGIDESYHPEPPPPDAPSTHLSREETVVHLVYNT